MIGKKFSFNLQIIARPQGSNHFKLLITVDKDVNNLKSPPLF